MMNSIHFLEFYVFMILVHLSRIKQVDTIECKTQQLPTQPTYCFKNCSPPNSNHISNLVYTDSIDKFDNLCVTAKLNNQIDSTSNTNTDHEVVLKTNVAKYPFNSIENRKSINVFVFDYLFVSGDIYIDFTDIDLNKLKSIQKPSNKETTLILNLVSRQFVTFRIFNLPSKRSDYLTDIKIFLNGDCSLDLIDKKGDVKIEVLHAPIYDLNIDRKNWIEYLNRIFGNSEERYDYKEYLSKFCHVYHIRVDINKLLIESNSNEKEFDLVRNDFIESLEAIAGLIMTYFDYYLTQNCSVDSIRTINNEKNKFKEEKSYLESLNTYYLFEIEQYEDVEQVDSNLYNYLRFFVKECNIYFNYHLIFYVNRIDANIKKLNFSIENNLKKLIIDDSNCRISIYSNSIVYDLQGEVYTNFTKINEDLPTVDMNNADENDYIHEYNSDIDNDNLNNYNLTNYLNEDNFNKHENDYENEAYKFKNRLYEPNDSQMSRMQDQHQQHQSRKNNNNNNNNNNKNNYLKEKIVKIMSKNHNLTMKSFFYLKIISNANEIELRFSSDKTSSDITATKFLNIIKNQIFLQQDEPNKKFSIKFVLSEKDLLEYFTNRYLDLAKYLKKKINYLKETSSSSSQDISKNNFHKSLKLKQYDHELADADYEYFFITNKYCRTLFLNTESSYRPDSLFLLFNSNLYEDQDSSKCYYHEISSNIFYMTFGFSLRYDNYTNLIYFTIKGTFNTQEDNQFISSKNQQNINKDKLKSWNDYFNNVLLNTIESSYQVRTRKNILFKSNKKISETGRIKKSRFSESFNNYNLEVALNLKTLDNSISWTLDTCWLSDKVCFDEIEHSSFFSHKEHSNEKDFETDYDQFDYEYVQYLESNLNSDEIYENNIQLNQTKRKLIKEKFFHHINFKIYKFNTTTVLNKTFKHYDQKIRINVTFFQLNNFEKKNNKKNNKFMLCSLRPYPSCNKSKLIHHQRNYEYTFKRSVENSNDATCEKNLQVMKFFSNKNTAFKIKTVLLASFDSNGLINDLDYDSQQDLLNENPKCPFLMRNENQNKNDLNTTINVPIDKILNPKQNSKYDLLIEKIKMNKLTIILATLCILLSIFSIILVKILVRKYNCLSYTLNQRSSKNMNNVNNKLSKSTNLSKNKSDEHDRNNEQQIRLLDNVLNDHNLEHVKKLPNGNSNQITIV